MINLNPVPAFTPQQYQSTGNYMDDDTMFYFMTNTTEFFQVEDNDEVLALLGVVPLTALSRHALLWFGPIEGVEFTLGHIRQGKALGEVFFDRMPYDFYAEVAKDEPQAQAFVKFFGMKQSTENSTRYLYVREK